MQLFPISSSAGVLAVLTGICAFFFWLEVATRWRLFQYLPPLVFIYLTPVILTNVHVLPAGSPAYDAVKQFVLPMMLVLMLLNVDVTRAVRLVGRGVGVMLFGAAGIVVGMGVGYGVVRHWLEPGAWKSFGALAGSWVGGTGNLGAVSAAVGASGVEEALAIMADTAWLLVWLPAMLTSRKFAAPFAKFARVDHQRVAELDAAIAADVNVERAANYKEFLILLFVAFAVTAVAKSITGAVSESLAANDRAWPQQFSEDTCFIMLVTTIGILLSFTPLRRVPASRELAMALIFLYMARTGATADLSKAAGQAVPFLIGAGIAITVHGLFCLVGAKLFRTDIHTAAIASAANIGGIATATCVAAHHKEGLLPAAILLALLGYALGNYAGLLAAWVCHSIA